MNVIAVLTLVFSAACLISCGIVLVILAKLSEVLTGAFKALASNPLAGLFSNDFTAETREK